MMKLFTKNTLRLTDEQLEREAYTEQRAEARANGVDIGSFRKWKEKHDRINKLLSKEGK
jgi:hypothetical protein